MTNGSAQIREPSDWGIPGTYVFDHTRSRVGYQLNKMAHSLTDPANRAAFKQDEEAFMARFKLTEQQKDAIRRRDWLTLTRDCGGNMFYIYKIGAAVGHGLYQMGAQMRGETYEQFLATRNVKGVR
jgi:protocatechuate 4,5-dioxygenase alpha chain